uniref:Lola_5 protein n=1 Tax=Fopius arisanus TaxID=64838 RepID=A0A0C9PPG8_9HYME
MYLLPWINHHNFLIVSMTAFTLYVPAGWIYTCNYCDKSYVDPRDLHDHETRYCPTAQQTAIRRKSENDYNCQRCGASYNRMANLRAHVRDDCGKVHQCKDCMAIFKQRSGLYHHRKRCRMMKSCSQPKFG